MISDIEDFLGIAGAFGATIVYPIDMGEFTDIYALKPL